MNAQHGNKNTEAPAPLVRSRPVFGRGRTAATLLAGPWEWRLALTSTGWFAVLPLLKRVMTLPQLATLMWSRESGDSRNLDREERATAIVRGLARCFGGNCLERSLVLYRVLSRAGADPLLVAGIGSSNGYLGHAWIKVEGRSLFEDEEPAETYSVFMRFGREGRLL